MPWDLERSARHQVRWQVEIMHPHRKGDSTITSLGIWRRDGDTYATRDAARDAARSITVHHGNGVKVRITKA